MPVVVPEALTASTAAASLSISSRVRYRHRSKRRSSHRHVRVQTESRGLRARAVLVAGVVASLQFTGPATVAGGEPAKDGPSIKETAKTESAPAKADPPPKSARLSADYEPFQGDWVVSEAENGNAIGTAAAGVDDRWRFTGDLLTTGGEIKEDAVEKFTLDSRAKPATIDFAPNHINTDGSGRFHGTTYHGVYKFEPDGRLVICYRVKTDDGRNLRPSRFATVPHFGATLLTLRRPAPPEMPIPLIPSLPTDPPRAFEQKNLAPRDTRAPIAPPTVDVPPPAIPTVGGPDLRPLIAPTPPPSHFHDAFDASQNGPRSYRRRRRHPRRISILPARPGLGITHHEPARIIEFVKDRILRKEARTGASTGGNKVSQADHLRDAEGRRPQDRHLPNRRR